MESWAPFPRPGRHGWRYAAWPAYRSALAALLAHAHRDLDRGALEAELLAQATLEEAAVARLDEARGEDDEARRTRRRLRREEDARLFAAAHSVRVRGHDLAEEGVEAAGRHAGVPRLERRLDRRHQPVHVPPGEGRHVGPRRPRHLHELLVDLALEVVTALLVEGVPLVVGDDERATGVDDLLHDADVLLRDRLGRVDEHDGDLGLLERRLRAQRGVEVGTARLVHAAADARGVHEAPRLATELDQLVDGVAGRPGDVVDDDPLGAGEPVEQAGLARRWAARRSATRRGPPWA